MRRNFYGNNSESCKFQVHDRKQATLKTLLLSQHALQAFVRHLYTDLGFLLPLLIFAFPVNGPEVTSITVIVPTKSTDLCISIKHGKCASQCKREKALELLNVLEHKLLAAHGGRPRTTHELRAEDRHAQHACSGIKDGRSHLLFC